MYLCGERVAQTAVLREIALQILPQSLPRINEDSCLPLNTHRKQDSEKHRNLIRNPSRGILLRSNLFTSRHTLLYLRISRVLGRRCWEEKTDSEMCHTCNAFCSRTYVHQMLVCRSQHHFPLVHMRSERRASTEVVRPCGSEGISATVTAAARAGPIARRKKGKSSSDKASCGRVIAPRR